jgi:hypothetical protein
MALSKRMERKLYGPSMLEVTCGSVLSVLVGILLAAVFLVFKPVEIVKEMPKAEERKLGTVYYVEGTNDATRAKLWRAKRKALLEGTPGEIVFSEDEINSWLAAGSDANAPEPAKPAPAPKAAAAKTPPPKAGEAPPAPPPGEFFTLASPEVRIADTFQVGMRGTFNYAGSQFPVVVQAQGGFEKQGDVLVYQPDALYIGSLPIHTIPRALPWGVSKLAAWLSTSQTLPENAVGIWKRVSTVTVEGRQVKVVVQ